MTFEEFKKDFEIFSKLDTPEKIALCEKQYKTHLLMIEDAEHFEPDDEYEQKLNGIPAFDNISEDQFAYLSVPAFDADNLLVIERKQNDYKLLFVAQDILVATATEEYVLKKDKSTLAVIDNQLQSLLASY